MNRLPSLRRMAALGLLGALAAGSVSAHITLAERTAPSGGYARVTLQVPHGCSGRATTGLAVELPPGLASVKPMPKPGWTLTVKKGKYAKPYNAGHGELTEGVLELSWSGGKLPDDNYDEFVLSVYLIDELKPDAMLYFPVVQECQQGVHRWIEVPEAGKPADLPEPAPGLKLLPARRH